MTGFLVERNTFSIAVLLFSLSLWTMRSSNSPHSLVYYPLI